MRLTWRGRVFKLLFPLRPRQFPHRRAACIVLRTAHIMATGIFLGGHVLGVTSAPLEPWLWLSVISGLLLFAIDLHASFVALFEVHGIVVMVKILLLLTLPLFWQHRVALLIVILVIGSISSHMPGRYRHKLLLYSTRLAPYQRRARE